ncbi:hypothetical protein SAMN04487977_101470 [Treponema bryantii]|uniref:Putative DnaT-like domain-containing protein n=1 Tax=Treponema bryantii TaxID=163 RepID=A0A1H9ATX3_9SPIR|nr:DnaT-like ssDNA-binding protein [Treponema bryantii]SEP80234.1 hypothetical protein SAMN04487977_101470 [Treponema bryantii]
MIVEDGTGKYNADSYVTVEFANDYFSDRGVTGWDSLTNSKKEQSLIRATDFIDNIYQWYGKKAHTEQSLRFPRIELKDYEGQDVVGVPTCLKQAVCDAAILVSKGTELFQTKNENGDVTSETITTLSFTYAKSDKSEAIASTTLYDSINTKLRGLFRDGSKHSIISGKVQRV